MIIDRSTVERLIATAGQKPNVEAWLWLSATLSGLALARSRKGPGGRGREGQGQGLAEGLHFLGR